MEKIFKLQYILLVYLGRNPVWKTFWIYYIIYYKIGKFIKLYDIKIYNINFWNLGKYKYF